MATHGRSVSGQSFSTKTLSEYSSQISILLDGSEPQRGWRSISTKTFHSSSSEGSITIPEDLESDECLVFLGFKKAAAASIMRHYFDAKKEMSGFLWSTDDILPLATSHIELREDVWGPDEDWDLALKHMGINREARNAILDPEFDYIRLSGTAQSVAIETVELRWEFLNTLDIQIARKVKPLEAPTLDVERSVSPTGPARPARRPQRTLTFAPDPAPSPLIASEISIPPLELDLHTHLFKGGAETRFSGLVNVDGSLSIGAIFSSAPTDFSPDSTKMIYFTKHREIARDYAQYASNRSNGRGNAGIITFAVPNDLLANPYEVVGDEWRDVVWTSRRGDRQLLGRLDRLPGRLRHISEHPLLIGPICGDAPKKVTKMGDASELNMTKTPSSGEKATQYAFQTTAMLESLEERCKGKSFIFKSVDIMLAALLSELGFLANPVGSHVQHAEMGNQALNSLALISACYTHTGADVLSKLAAAHLLAVCQVLDLSALRVQFLNALAPPFRALLIHFLTAAFPPLLPLHALHAALWPALQHALDNSTSMDSAQRVPFVARTLQPTIIALAPPTSSQSSTLLLSLLDWTAALAALLAETHPATVDAYFAHGSAAPLLSAGSRCMYEFVRRELGVPFLRTEVIKTLDDAAGADAGAGRETPTVGTLIGRIHAALRDGRMNVPAGDCWR